ncbi:hypothetical protein N0V88_002870 [Collariella sp. IMI 366227]|nr:hypothetical protein N0V88_002870 [Collariella sp. IMI 366227]
MRVTTPPRRPVMAETISAMEDLTVMSSPSFGAVEDVEMDEAYWAEQSDGEEQDEDEELIDEEEQSGEEEQSEEEEMSEEGEVSEEEEESDEQERSEDQMSVDNSNDSSSFNAGGSMSLRGGSRLDQPPAFAWARKAVARPRKVGKDEENYRDDGIEDDEDDEMMDDAVEETYQPRKNVVKDDGNDSSSDWDGYGDLPLTMGEYNKMVSRLEGSEDWNKDQKKLHKLIYMRGLHPMLPSWWRISFRMWGVTQPHLDDVFRPKNSRKRVAIHCHGNELAACKALESLFYLSQYVTDYEEIGQPAKIAPFIVKTVRNYIRWAMRDAGMDHRKTQRNMFVRAYPPDFVCPDDRASNGSARQQRADRSLAAEITVAGDDSTKPKAKPKKQTPNDDDDDDLTEAERARRFTEAVSKDVERRLRAMGQRWRERLHDKNKLVRGYLAPPPTLYAFAVVQHIVLLASHDAGSVMNPVVVLEQVRLNDRGQWLWNALSLALPIVMARDALNRMWDTGVVKQFRWDEDGDPDL